MSLVDGLEGYPVLFPPWPRPSFVEVLESLAGGWKNGLLVDEFINDDKTLLSHLVRSIAIPSLKTENAKLTRPYNLREILNT